MGGEVLENDKMMALGVQHLALVALDSRASSFGPLSPSSGPCIPEFTAVDHGLRTAVLPFKGDEVFPRQLECFILPRERFDDSLKGNHLLAWFALHYTMAD